VWPSSAGPSVGRGDSVNAGDFRTVGGIGVGAYCRGTRGDVVNRGLDTGDLGARGLSASTIGGGGPASRVLGSSGNSFNTIGSDISGTGMGNGGRSLLRAIAAMT
jgi:hypothetical protein